MRALNVFFTLKYTLHDIVLILLYHTFNNRTVNYKESIARSEITFTFPLSLNTSYQYPKKILSLSYNCVLEIPATTFIEI